MIEKKLFGEIAGREVSLYILKNDCLEVSLSDYGATIVRARLTLKNGEVRDLVRGYDTLESYMNADGYLGAVVGRVGNRICKGKFTLDGKDYEQASDGDHYEILPRECQQVFIKNFKATHIRLIVLP